MSRTPAASWIGRPGIAERMLGLIHALDVRIDSVGSTQLSLGASAAFERVTTIVTLADSDGRVGRGEDISYAAPTQAELPAAIAQRTDLVGHWTMGSLAEHLDANPPRVASAAGWDDKPGYHRWAIESAALDLALRQHDMNLAMLAGVAWENVQVSLSMGLGNPPSAQVLHDWLASDSSITFKLDAATTWTSELVAELSSLDGAVRTIDFKGLYTGDWADKIDDPALYAAVGRGLSGALLEDAKLTAEVLDILDADALQRLTWDFPITRMSDVPGLAGAQAAFSDLRPAAINIKPSRFGSFERLLTTIAHCDHAQIPCYSGGQYELGYGRTQVQAIASLCFADAPNDCAPVAFHGATPDSPDLPLGPVVPPPDHVGFGWDV